MKQLFGLWFGAEFTTETEIRARVSQLAERTLQKERKMD